MIELQNVSKIYGQGDSAHQALSDINLTVAAGEIFGIIGKSGAGKSTLIRCVNCLEKPSNGKVFIDGVDITILSEHELRCERHEIGMIFQHFNLMATRDVFDNIAFPLTLQNVDKKQIDQKVSELLELVELSERAHYFPSQLSGGQKQRVAIARALASNPKVLLCDEATSALDPETTKAILTLLKAINKKTGITILLITHEMDVIKQICHRVGVLSDGELIEQGTVVDVFTQPRHPLTKRLIDAALHIDLPESILSALTPEYRPGTHPVAKLAFVGDSVREPVTSTIAKRFDVATNILQADLEIIDDVTVGVFVCQLQGEHEACQQALAYFESVNIKVEVIGYGS